MCGIFGYTGTKKDAADIVLSGLKRLEYRGYDSWGVVVQSQSNTLTVKKKTGKIGDASVQDMPVSTVALGHTRWATHGGVTQKNSHPHLTEKKDIAIVHNGIIENYDVLKKRLKNHTFTSDTDSEVAAHLIEDLTKKYSFSESVRHAFLAMDGLNALIAVLSTGDELIGIRNGSPLVVGYGDGEYFIASDAAALLPHTRSVYFLEDFEGARVTSNGIEIFDAHTGKKKTVKKSKLNWEQEEGSRGSFDHFTLKEIHDQPDVVQKIAAEDLVQAKRHAQEIKKSYGTYYIGCGTAAYACMAGSYIFSDIAKRHVNWAVASEFGFQLDFLTKKSLVVALSQSGETMDTVEALKKAREKGARIGGLVNVEGSTLHRMADVPMGLHAGIEKGVCSTKAFTAKIAHLILTAYALAGDIDTGVSVITDARRSLQKLLKKDQIAPIKKLARLIARHDHAFIVGRGLSYPASLEAALKIKEISYVHAEGFAAGELKHGVIALIEKGTPCIVFAPSDGTFHENIAGAMEMKARGGYIIGISEKPHEVFDMHIPVSHAGVATIIPNVAVVQLLAYYTSVAKGLDPDMPRNLAKSVTVK